MKKLILLLTILLVSITGHSQLVFKNGQTTLKVDTISVKGDTLYIVNKTTREVCKAKIVNGALKIQNIYTFTDTLVKFRQFVDSLNRLKATKLDITGTAANSALWQGKDSVYWKALIALKKSSNDTILRTGYMPVGRANDSLAAIRNDMSSIVGGEPVYLADSAAIKATIRTLPTTYLGIYVTAANSALLQGKDSIYIKANWGNEAIYLADSAYLKGNVRKLLALADTTSELVARTIYVSMPTDPQTPGSDVTGTGTSLLPYATINKALSKIKNNMVAAITIQVDSGTFDMTRTEYKVIDSKEGGGNLLIIGTLSLITNLSAYAYRVPAADLMSIKFPYPSAIDSSSLKKFYLKIGTLYFPIYDNTRVVTALDSVTCYIPFNITTGALGGIYQASTILESRTSLTERIKIYSSRVNLQLSKLYVKNVQYEINSSNFTAAHVNFDGLRIISPGAQDNLFTTNSAALTLNRCYLSKTYRTLNSTSSRIIFGSSIAIPDISVATHIFSLTNSDFYALNLICGNAAYTYHILGNTSVRISGYMRYVCDNGALSLYRNYSPGNHLTDLTTKTYVEGTTTSTYYPALLDLSDNTNNTSYNLDISKFVFLKAARFPYYYLPTTGRPTKYVDPSCNYSVYIKGIDYPEIEQKQSYTLANNSTDSISIADLTYNRTVTITYNIVRNGVYRAGTMKVLITGTNYYFDPGEFFPAANDLGITFDGVYRSGTSNTLKLKWTTTNTGFAATITIDYNRQNFKL